MQHLARALREPRARRALAVRWRLQSALLPLLANDMRVPAEDRAGRCRPDLAVPRAPHRADEDERSSRSVGIDQRFGAREVEDGRPPRLLVTLRVKEEDASVAALAWSRACVVPRTGCGTYVSPTPSSGGCDESVEDQRRPRSLARRCERDRRIFNLCDERVLRRRARGYRAGCVRHRGQPLEA